MMAMLPVTRCCTRSKSGGTDSPLEAEAEGLAGQATSLALLAGGGAPVCPPDDDEPLLLLLLVTCTTPAHRMMAINTTAST